MTSITTYEIKSEDVYEEFSDLFDFSEHQPELFDKTNKKVAGKMKDVHKGKPICKFVA